jgi:hypothetical protein
MARQTLYYEQQRFSPLRLRILTAIVPAAMLLLSILQVGFGLKWGQQSNGSLIGWTVFLWLVYFRLMTVKLVTEIRPGELRVALRGLWRSRKIPLSDVTEAKVVSFDPARDWGGYGIRATRRGRAYIAAGNEGVEVRTRRSGMLLIGSARAAQLAREINAQSPARMA